MKEKTKLSVIRNFRGSWTRQGTEDFLGRYCAWDKARIADSAYCLDPDGWLTRVRKTQLKPKKTRARNDKFSIITGYITVQNKKVHKKHQRIDPFY
jgi:hypothetical protein